MESSSDEGGGDSSGGGLGEDASLYGRPQDAPHIRGGLLFEDLDGSSDDNEEGANSNAMASAIAPSATAEANSGYWSHRTGLWRQTLEVQATQAAPLTREGRLFKPQGGGGSLNEDASLWVRPQAVRAPTVPLPHVRGDQDEEDGGFWSGLSSTSNTVDFASASLSLRMRPLAAQAAPTAQEQESYHGSVKAWEASQVELWAKDDRLKERRDRAQSKHRGVLRKHHRQGLHLLGLLNWRWRRKQPWQ